MSFILYFILYFYTIYCVSIVLEAIFYYYMLMHDEMMFSNFNKDLYDNFVQVLKVLKLS